MDDRHRALADVLGSARLEDAQPSPETVEAVQAWADGELSTEELGELAERAAAGEPLSRNIAR